ncbi:hypothetical protein KUC85_01225 [Pseudomonas aeruginosa]|uniref:hypothetical protein n=1 Tax=Pseudomonas aeruginosa TaxID=287 RepID=UPI000CFEE5AC|nr:hypothetical protein [Pseudomonas aeruginosa]MBH4429370.1 hypothetical protein [Pseudomonas aeruginosa]MBH4482673.1 hypothetical protein [Pseudomonas aeruginosa]MCV0027222.1 hypothetical protein [Pseudomonas aeruginosa]MDY1062237.1 hypothetical protein [Pseudomonas aeruginosa]RUI41287.1 hypothetical protein IPC414_07790 [Pseudomonas aeruginosa]
MTMISGFTLKGGGFLEADILLTSPDTWARSWPVPSIPGGDDSSTLENHIVAGLCQKILVVNDHFAVAFAGDVPAIQEVVRLIDRLVDQSPVLTSKRFSDAVLADQTINIADINIIVLTVEDGEVLISNVCADYGHENDHFDQLIGGSGGYSAVEHFQDYPPHAFDVLEEDIVAHGACMALHHFSGHLNSELSKRFQSESIVNLYGGGYEVVAYYDGRFQKISNIVYVFADAEYDADGKIQVDFPKHLIKSAYDGDNLKIRSVELQCDEDSDEHFARNDCTFTIAPVSRYHETNVEKDLDDLKFKGEFLCFLVNVKRWGGVFTIPFIKKYESELHFLCKAFVASVDVESVQIIYSSIFEEEFSSHVMKYMKQLESAAKEYQN